MPHQDGIIATVIICTFNRATLLRDAFDSVANQEFDKRNFEIIIVDNNSIDATPTIAQSLARSTDIRTLYVLEKQQGLSYARNAGLRAARGKIVCYIDDDIIVCRGWLRALIGAFTNPVIACAGGPVHPIWPKGRPSWLVPEWEWCLSINEFTIACKNREFTWPRDLPIGANIAFRKEVLHDMGSFATHLGRNGSRLLSGEEVDICKKIIKNGFKIACSPSAVAYHKIDVQRMEKKWFYKRLYWEGRTNALLEDRHPIKGIQKGMYNFFSTSCIDGIITFSKQCGEMVAIGYLDQSIRNGFIKAKKIIARFKWEILFSQLSSYFLRHPKNIPPAHMIFVGGGVNDFKKVGEMYLALLKEVGHLRKEDDILDLGCGIGRIALPLTKYLSLKARYEGLDIVNDAIVWCKRNISSRFDNFNFTCIDVYNGAYLPSGKIQAAELKLPYGDGIFDIVFLGSVFTHMVPHDIRNYVKEIHRVLKKGGRCFVTFFLINQESQDLIASKLSTIDFIYSTPEYYTTSMDCPENAIGLNEQWIIGLFHEFNFNVHANIYYGSWCGRNNPYPGTFQDIVLAFK